MCLKFQHHTKLWSKFIEQILNAWGRASIQHEFATTKYPPELSNAVHFVTTQCTFCLHFSFNTITFNGLSILQFVIFRPRFYSMSILSCPWVRELHQTIKRHPPYSYTKPGKLNCRGTADPIFPAVESFVWSKAAVKAVMSRDTMNWTHCTVAMNYPNNRNVPWRNIHKDNGGTVHIGYTTCLVS